MAPTYLSPGVYVEEVSGGSKPIAAVGTAVAAFVGFAQRGPVNQATLVTNWSQYVENFGEFMEGSYLAHSVYGYFNNGGGRCYIVRIGASEDAGSEDPSAAAALPADTSTAIDTLNVTALGSGEDASGISVEITHPEGTEEEPANPDLFNVIVRRGGQDVETYENLSMGRGRGVRNVTVVNDQSTLIRVNVAEASSALPLTRCDLWPKRRFSKLP